MLQNTVILPKDRTITNSPLLFMSYTTLTNEIAFMLYNLSPTGVFPTYITDDTEVEVRINNGVITVRAINHTDLLCAIQHLITFMRMLQVNSYVELLKIQYE